MFAAWGRFVYRFRWLVLVASILSIAAVSFSMQYGGRLGTGEFSAPEGTESGRVEGLLDEEVAKTPPSFMLVFGNEDEEATDPAFRDGVDHALKPFVHPERTATGRGLWHRLATAVMAHPWRTLLPAVALLLVLGSPFLTRIIHERSGRLRFARPKIDEYAATAAYIGHIGPNRSTSRFPYSSTKLGLVNDPG